MSTALIERDNYTVKFTIEARTLKADALEASALIGKVQTPGENNAAVEAQGKLKGLLESIEQSRKEVKEPVLQLAKRIDGAAASFREEIEQEFVRVSALIGDFQTLEQARARAAEAARNQELTDLERQRQEAIAQAATHDEADKINEHYTEKLAAHALAPMPAPARAAGQTVKHDWEITVTNIWDLARAHPSCVKMEPRLGEIKNLLNAGIKVPVVTAAPVVKASVRVKKLSAIEV